MRDEKLSDFEDVAEHFKESKKLKTIKKSDYYFALTLILSSIFMNGYFITNNNYFWIAGFLLLVMGVLSVFNRKIRNELNYEKQVKRAKTYRRRITR